MLFKDEKALMADEYKNVCWIEASGLPPEALKAGARALEESLLGEGPAIVTAKVFDYVLTNGQIALDAHDLFQDKLNHAGIMGDLRWRRMRRVYAEKGLDVLEQRMDRMLNERGAFAGYADYGHVCLGWEDLLSLGLPGLKARLKNLPEDGDYRRSGEIVLDALMKWALRLAEAARPTDPDGAACLEAIACRAPKTLREAMQLMILYFAAYELIGGGRARTLGRLDVLLRPFAEKEDEETVRELVRFFLFKFAAADIPFDQPFEVGGGHADGSEATCFLSDIIIDEYSRLGVHSPKIHVRVSDNTPDSFLRLVIGSIRDGASSMVLCSDRTVIESLVRNGMSREDAAEYVMIGCYEARANGEHVSTGDGSVNLGKAIELALNNGHDMATGELLTAETGPAEAMRGIEDLKAAAKEQVRLMCKGAMDAVCACEAVYPQINPDPLFSVTMAHSVETGTDIFTGGAKYNNSSLNCAGIATLTDSLLGAELLLHDMTAAELRDLMKADWAGREALRMKVRHMPEHYGNAQPRADGLARELSAWAGQCVCGTPNGRGGTFKPGLFSIDRYWIYGKNTAATPDGRHAGDPVSKNLCATLGCDKAGVTALCASAAQMDLTAFANGSVLDVVYHPSAVAGEEGIAALIGVTKTFFDMGGYAIHGNVFSADTLIAAQKNPEAYAGLQVRVCGWNVFFVNLSKKEQDDFIARAV